MSNLNFTQRAKKQIKKLAIPFGIVALMIFAFSSSSPVEAGDPKPCIGKKFKYKQVSGACKDGGQKAVKKLMKAVVKKANKAGDDNASECLSCHKNLKTFERTPNAVKWLKPYMK